MNNTKVVIYGDTRLEVPASTSIEDLKSAMAEHFPELTNADVHEIDNQVIFAPKAGTKGSDNMVVIYGDTRLEVPAETSIESLKSAMAEHFPELTNADVHRVDNQVIFAPKAGTKGIQA